MSFKIKSLPEFSKNLKKLVKKYPCLKSEFISFVHSLKLNPNIGTSIGKNCFKIRISIASKGRGKSGGAGVITYVLHSDNTIYLLSIYDKADKETLSKKELEYLL